MRKWVMETSLAYYVSSILLLYMEAGPISSLTHIRTSSDPRLDESRHEKGAGSTRISHMQTDAV
ncbi:hypothetical protein PV02_09865 [Methanolobus chelungpuianus]|uniref:Uncharacterized protein n=1 Tax=Methanolobus chelungpuianus TaxID=502115 RepID=A0AAE3HBY6_9EURY|nr:hypothetical protein [Methanolobus chelungpuianus]